LNVLFPLLPPLVLPLVSTVGIGARVGMTNWLEDPDELEDEDEDNDATELLLLVPSLKGAGFGECERIAQPPRKLTALPVAIRTRKVGLM
jgi:hypothetical protein